MIRHKRIEAEIFVPENLARIKAAIKTLKEAGVFEYLNSWAKDTLNTSLDLKVNSNELVVASAKHAGYVGALDFLEEMAERSFSIDNVNTPAKYGVRKEDVL